MNEDDLTGLLRLTRDGDSEAREELFGQLVLRMKTAADALMVNERVDHTLQPSALLNEAVIRLLSSDAFKIAENRRYLFAAANQAMKRVLIDHARYYNAEKRSRGSETPLDTVLNKIERRDRTTIGELTDAIDVLSKRNPRQAEVLDLNYFAGMQLEEISTLLGISLATVKRDLTLAKAKLAALLQ